MTEKQRALADYMIRLSEEAYSASWMDGLEYKLWEALEGRINKFGRLQFNHEILEELKKLSDSANGWITYDNEEEEKFVPFTEWEKIRKNNSR